MSFLAPASPGQLAEILDATFPLWGEGLDRAGYERYNDAQRRTPWGGKNLERLVLTDGRRWLSTTKRYRLKLRVAGRECEAVGIGALFTPRALRGRGLAAELLSRVLDQASGEGAEYALLFSEIGARYYQRQGFASIPLSQVRLDVKPLQGPAGIALRSGEARDIDSICAMNERQAEGSRFSMARHPEYVAFAIAKKRLLAASGPAGRRRVEFLAVEEGARAAAYLVLLQSGEYWMLTECGDRDPSGARVGAMLQSLLAARGREETPIRLRAWLPPGFLPPQLAVAVREAPPLTMMLRPLGRPALPVPPLTERDVAYWHADAF